MEQKKTIAFHTLGCKLNYSETSTLQRSMQAEGFEKKNFDEVADVYVINTCSVTENADKECKQLIRKLQRLAPNSTKVITGCYAQLKPTEIANINGVDLVLGAAEKFNLAKHIKDYIKSDSAKICSCDIDQINGFTSSWSMGDRTRTFLKVQDGCIYNCSFCTIPLARGHSRSDSIANVLQNISQISAQGTKEIVLTGINLGDFGNTNKTENIEENSIENFYTLLQKIETHEGVSRYRISSIEPNLLSHEIINFVAKSKKIMPHFHIPLQSGSNTILGNMRRRYKRELYAEKIQQIKTLMPHCCIGVDVIVGFPGEGEKEFTETFDFLHHLDISYLHVFTYSERLNTKALEFSPIIPVSIRNERNKILRNLSYKKMNYFTEQHAQSTRPVLFEKHNKNGKMEGYTDNYIRIETLYNETKAGEIIDWLLP